MENMKGFHPSWQVKPWVLVVGYLLTMLLVALCTASCTTSKHFNDNNSFNKAADSFYISASTKHPHYVRCCEPTPSRVR